MASTLRQTANAVAQTVPFTGAVLSGSSISVFYLFTSEVGAVTPTITDNVNTARTYTNESIALNSTDGYYYGSAKLDSSAAGTPTVTLVFPGAAPAITLVVASEISTTAGYNAQNSNLQLAPGTGTGAITSGGTNIPTVQPGLLIALTLGNTATSPPLAGTGFTDNGSLFNVGAGNIARLESKTYSSTSTATPATFTAATGQGSVDYATMVQYFADGTPPITLTPQTISFSQGAVTVTNSTPAAPIRSAPLAPLQGSKAFGPLGMGGFAIRSMPFQPQATGIASISGQTITFTQGTFTPAGSGSVTVTGQTITFAQGTMTATHSGSSSITGQTVSFTQGTFTPSSAGNASVTAQTISFSQGTMTASGGTANVTITGQTISFSQGTFSIQGTGFGSGWFVRRHNRHRF